MCAKCVRRRRYLGLAKVLKKFEIYFWIEVVPEGLSKTITDTFLVPVNYGTMHVLGPITDKKTTTCFLSLITLMAHVHQIYQNSLFC